MNFRTMTEIWFYQLQRQPLEKVLPVLIEKSLEKGWRVAVQARSEERPDARDSWHWTYSDASFLAHGRAAAAITIPDLRETIRIATDAFTPTDCQNYFAAAGDNAI